MKIFGLFILFIATTAADWFYGVVKFNLEAVWMLARLLWTEATVWHIAIFHGGRELQREHYQKWLADFRRRWTWRKETAAEDLAEVERLSRLRHPQLWREQE